MVKNTKAMSQIVTTVILVVLVLVAIGIVWGVISNLIGGGTDDIDLGTKCLGISVKGVAVLYDYVAAPGNYTVTFERNNVAGEIGGVKVVLSNSTSSSSVLDVNEAIEPLAKYQKTLEVGTDVINATSGKVTVYFVDGSGTEQLCPVSAEFTF